VVRNDASAMLAVFLAGTGVPRLEVEDIIRSQFPGSDPAAVADGAFGPQKAHTSQ
jgi:hypothetical protein